MSRTDLTKKSVLNLVDVIGRLAGILVGLSAIAYFVGYRIQNHYLTEAGAKWALGLLSPAEFIQEGQGVIIPIIFFAVSSVMALMNGETTADKLNRNDRIFSGIAIVLMLASFITSRCLDNRSLDYNLALIAGLTVSIAAGYTIGELIARLNLSEQNWHVNHLSLILFFYISAIFVGPYFIGTNRAKLDFYPATSALSFVTITNSEEEWRLVRTIGDKYLLVILSDEADKRKFRVVEAASDSIIKSNSKIFE